MGTLIESSNISSNSGIKIKKSENDFKFPFIDYIINDKYIVLVVQMNEIEIMLAESFKKLCNFEIKGELFIIHMQFHPKYDNILSISCSNHRVYLFDINNSKIDLKVTFICNKSENIIQTNFNPIYDTYLATLFYKRIKIWNINKYYYKYNIEFDKRAERVMKWSECGKYLIYNKNNNIIEIFSLTKGIVEYFFDSSLTDCYLLKNKNLLIIKDFNIILYDINNKKEILNTTNNFFNKKSIYDYNKSLLLLFNNDSFSLYDIKRNKFLYESKVNEYSEYFFLNMNDNKENIFSKVITYSEKNSKFKIFEFISDIYFNLYKDIKCNKITSNEDFWKDSIEKIYIKYDILSFASNKIDKNEFKSKSFLLNDEIIKKKKLNEKLTLKEKKNFVTKDKIIKIDENKDIQKVYFDYINLLIMDNTNKDLITNYLLFLIKNNEKLLEIPNLKYENDKKEIEHFKYLFNPKELLQFKIFNELSEQEKLMKLLEDIINVNIENNSNIDDFLDKKYLKYEDCDFFNQPISFENNNLYFYRNRLLILYSLRGIKEFKRYNKFKNMQYSCKEIFINNLFNKCKNKTQITFIIILIVSPQRPIITDYNINLINETNNIITKKNLLDLGFKPKKDENIKRKDIIKDDKDEDNKEVEKEDKFEFNGLEFENIQSYNLNNLELYSKNKDNKDNFQQYELLKCEEIKKYYEKQFDEKKLKNFLCKIFSSKVIKEAFEFFYGNDVVYPFKDEDSVKNYLDEYFELIVFKSDTVDAVTDKFTMETYTFLTPRIISLGLNDNENLKNNIKYITQSLLYSSLVSINLHELNHNFHNYYFFSKNGETSLKTPRKLLIDEREGGNNMERILFGKILNNLNLKQALYILNENNYSKSLYQFQTDFLILNEKDCKCEGIFKEFSLINLKDDEEKLDYITIRFKTSSFNRNFNNINLKNDVLGFPIYAEDNIIDKDFDNVNDDY